MDKILKIDGKEVGFRASALTPRLYRQKYGRDILRDLNRLTANFNRALKGVQAPVYPEGATKAEKAAIDAAHDQEIQNVQLDVLDLEIFENVAHIMARQYDKTGVPPTVDEWLEGFETFSIYEILPEILQLWGLQQKTTSVAQTKSGRPKKK